MVMSARFASAASILLLGGVRCVCFASKKRGGKGAGFLGSGVPSFCQKVTSLFFRYHSRGPRDRDTLHAAMGDIHDLDPRLITPGFNRWELTRWTDGEPSRKVETDPAIPETRGPRRALGGRVQPMFHATLTAEEIARDVETVNNGVFGTPHAPSAPPEPQVGRRGGGRGGGKKTGVKKKAPKKKAPARQKKFERRPSISAG